MNDSADIAMLADMLIGVATAEGMREKFTMAGVVVAFTWAQQRILAVSMEAMVDEKIRACLVRPVPAQAAEGGAS